MKKVLFISSTGGHLNELFQFQPLFGEYDSFLITEKTKTTRSLKKDWQSHMGYLLHGSKDHMGRYMFQFPYNIAKSFYYFFKFRPSVVVTTGAHTAVPMCYIAKMFRKKVIYVETYANISSKSLSGKLVYPIADVFVVQWESMKKLYPKAEYWGGVF